MPESYCQLYQGDCLEIVPTLPALSVDAILTDLPYGTTACKWDTIIPFDALWSIVKHVLKPRGAFVTTSSQPFTSALVMSNPKWFRYVWIWEKNVNGNFMNLKFAPRKLHDNIVVFGVSGINYNPQLETGAAYRDKPRARTAEIYSDSQSVLSKSEINNLGTRHPSSVQKFGNPNNSIEHPTQKPVALLSYLIRTYTNEGDTILDLCMGSGTTGVACIETNRNFIGIELDAGYFEIAERRIAEAKKQIRMF